MRLSCKPSSASLKLALSALDSCLVRLLGCVLFLVAGVVRTTLAKGSFSLIGGPATSLLSLLTFIAAYARLEHRSVILAPI